MENVMDIVRRQAEGALNRLDAREVVMAEHVADSVLRQTAYWEMPIQDDDKLLFVRFFSPAVQREEVFLGNVLFNAFLNKAFARAVAESESNEAELVANDLESYYFLVRATSDVTQLSNMFRSEVERSLPDLFFGEQDEARGVYGSVETMLGFVKANVEPFPVFIMPYVYAERLEKAVRESLLRKIEKSPLDRNPTSIMANLAFFYSHDGADMQSPYLFLARLALRHGVVAENDLRQALNLKKNEELGDEAALKKSIENSFKQKEGRTFSSAHLRQLLEKAVVNLGEKVNEQPDMWLMPYIRNKFLSHDEKALADSLLGGVSLGHVPVSSLKAEVDVGCRVCGVRLVEAEDKSILMGQNPYFNNQSSKQKNKQSPKTCLRCATCAYLMVKLIGSEAVGQPQVPKTYNLIFHYGRHNDEEVDHLTSTIDLVWSLVRQRREVEQIRRDVHEQIRNLKAKLEREQDERKKDELEAELNGKITELERTEANVAKVEDDIFAACPWLKDSNESPVPWENSSLDALANIQMSETKVERHVLGLGLGGYRMVLFVLPQIRAPYDAKEHDFAQRRFSDSRVTVTALLSFLRELCGCDGPFYYQSLPTLTPEAFQRDTFYVRDEPISVEQARNEYEVITQLAWRLVWQRGSDGFVRKVILAEKLLEDPLGTLGGVMRDSAILGQSKGSYRRLPGGYRQDWKAQDLTEYADFIRRLSKLQEVR
ncbi:MAG: hypothetical protein H0T57_02095 [Rubrobacter sp.]|nr:hypothetical protein [Rubrobacter sp.]